MATDEATDTGSGLWAGIFARLEGSLDGLGKALRRRNRLDAWAQPVALKLNPIAGAAAVAGGPLVFNLGGPPSGYYWRVRAIHAVGLIGANGNPTYVGNIVADVYVTPGAGGLAPTSAGTQVAQVPPAGDWYLSNLVNTTAGTAAVLPWEKGLGSEEMTINPGDYLFVSLSGTGVVTTTNFVVDAHVYQFQGFDALRE